MEEIMARLDALEKKIDSILHILTELPDDDRVDWDEERKADAEDARSPS